MPCRPRTLSIGSKKYPDSCSGLPTIGMATTLRFWRSRSSWTSSRPVLLAVVDGPAVEKAHELVERRTERDARVVDETPRAIQIAAGDVGRVESAAHLAGGHRPHDVAAELRRDGRDAGQLDEADLAGRSQRGPCDVVQLRGERIGRGTDGSRCAEAPVVDVDSESGVRRQRDRTRDRTANRRVLPETSSRHGPHPFSRRTRDDPPPTSRQKANAAPSARHAPSAIRMGAARSIRDGCRRIVTVSSAFSRNASVRPREEGIMRSIIVGSLAFAVLCAAPGCGGGDDGDGGSDDGGGDDDGGDDFSSEFGDFIASCDLRNLHQCFNWYGDDVSDEELAQFTVETCGPDLMDPCPTEGAVGTCTDSDGRPRHPGGPDVGRCLVCAGHPRRGRDELRDGRGHMVAGLRSLSGWPTRAGSAHRDLRLEQIGRQRLLDGRHRGIGRPPAASRSRACHAGRPRSPARARRRVRARRARRRVTSRAAASQRSCGL